MNTQKASLVALPFFLENAALLQKDTKSKLVRILWLLSQDFRHPSLQCKKVQGAKREVYECRVDQDFRLIYDIMGNMLRCWYVGKHDVALKYAQATSLSDTVVQVDDIVICSMTSDEIQVSQFLDEGIEPDGFVSFPIDHIYSN